MSINKTNKQNKMKLNSLIPFIGCLLLLFSCRGREQYPNATCFTYDDFPRTEHLQGNSFGLDDLLCPTIVKVKDTILFVINSRGEHFLDLYNLNTKHKIKELVAVGPGPEELIMCNSLQITQNNVYLADIQQNKFIVYPYPALLEMNNNKADTSFSVRNVAMQNPLYVSDNRFVANDLRAENQILTFFDCSDQKEDLDIPMPIPLESEPSFSQKRIFETRMTISPDHERIFATYVNTDLIDIYDQNGKLLHRFHGPDQFFPHLIYEKTATGTVVIPDKENKLTYLSPVATDEELWVLYIGASPERYKPLPANRIFVFNDDGRPVTQYILDIPIFNFCIDEKNKILYGITDDPEFDIICFNY